MMTFKQFLEKQNRENHVLIREENGDRHILLEFCYMADESDKNVKIFIKEFHVLLKRCFENKEILSETSENINSSIFKHYQVAN